MPATASRGRRFKSCPRYKAKPQVTVPFPENREGALSLCVSRMSVDIASGWPSSGRRREEPRRLAKFCGRSVSATSLQMTQRSQFQVVHLDSPAFGLVLLPVSLPGELYWAWLDARHDVRSRKREPALLAAGAVSVPVRMPRPGPRHSSGSTPSRYWRASGRRGTPGWGRAGAAGSPRPGRSRVRLRCARAAVDSR
jgi:hypothetical protein